MSDALAVYAVLIVMGKTVASIGPWPAEIAACLSNVPKSNKDLDATFADAAKVAKLREAWPGVERHQVEWTCIESATKPVIANSVRLPSQTSSKPTSDRMSVGE